MKKKLVYILDGLRVSTFSANFPFCLNYSFKTNFAIDKKKPERQKVGNIDEFTEKDAELISLIFMATDCIINQG